MCSRHSIVKLCSLVLKVKVGFYSVFTFFISRRFDCLQKPNSRGQFQIIILCCFQLTRYWYCNFCKWFVICLIFVSRYYFESHLILQINLGFKKLILLIELWHRLYLYYIFEVTIPFRVRLWLALSEFKPETISVAFHNESIKASIITAMFLLSSEMPISYQFCTTFCDIFVRESEWNREYSTKK